MKQKNILIFIIIFIIIFVIFAIYCNNYSSFGATGPLSITVPQGTNTYKLVLKDTQSKELVTSSIPITGAKINTVLVTGYKDGIISYTLNGGAVQTIQTQYNTIPLQTKDLYTLNNQTTNCISQYDADRRGVGLNDLVSNTCKAAGFPGGSVPGSPLGCDNSGFKYICNGNVLSNVTFVSQFTIAPTSITYTTTDTAKQTSAPTVLINGSNTINNFPIGGYITITISSADTMYPVIYYYGNSTTLPSPIGSWMDNLVTAGNTYTIPVITINVSVATGINTVTL